jgi:hypothetical protein
MTENSKPRTLVEVHFIDPDRRAEFFDGIVQILMTGETDMSLTYGTQVTFIPYRTIREIRVSFRYDGSSNV